MNKLIFIAAATLITSCGIRGTKEPIWEVSQACEYDMYGDRLQLTVETKCRIEYSNGNVYSFICGGVAKNDIEKYELMKEQLVFVDSIIKIGNKFR